ncbi:hypothetical protein P4H79_35230, partial [Paenibacillus anseongense]|nr:hypothetical protein [Paenibacillus anseongense]
MKVIVKTGNDHEHEHDNVNESKENLDKLAIDEEGNLSEYNPITNMTPEEKELKIQEDIPDNLEDVKRVLEERVGLNRSFDLVLREMVFGSKRVGIFYCNGFVKDTVLSDILT